MDYRKGLKNAAYVCMRLAILGGVLWVCNVIYFFIEYFNTGVHVPNFQAIITGYGGALIAAIVPILVLYCLGGVVTLLLDIEANTKHS